MGSKHGVPSMHGCCCHRRHRRSGAPKRTAEMARCSSVYGSGPPTCINRNRTGGDTSYVSATASVKLPTYWVGVASWRVSYSRYFTASRRPRRNQLDKVQRDIHLAACRRCRGIGCEDVQCASSSSQLRPEPAAARGVRSREPASIGATAVASRLRPVR